MLLKLPEDIARRLENRAEQAGMSIPELLDRMLTNAENAGFDSLIAPVTDDNRHEESDWGADIGSEKRDEPPRGSLAALAKAAREAGLRTAHPVDTAERSREILESEYAEDLKRRKGSDSDRDPR